ncbi:MAG: hypothetical protein RL514_3498 [Verrucomicrobiota bacterium]|jgi:hypothetical protein
MKMIKEFFQDYGVPILVIVGTLAVLKFVADKWAPSLRRYLPV